MEMIIENIENHSGMDSNIERIGNLSIVESIIENSENVSIMDSNIENIGKSFNYGGNY